jgi:hypothetical protein
MIISRRPNKRASMDRAPGPSKTIAPATITTRMAESLSSIRLWAGAGNHDIVMAAQPKPVKMAPTGVRNPSNNDAPLAIANNPGTQTLKPLPPSR